MRNVSLKAAKLYLVGKNMAMMIFLDLIFYTNFQNDYNEDAVPNPRTTNYTPFQVHGNETPPEEIYRPRQFRTRPKGYRNQREGRENQ